MSLTAQDAQGVTPIMQATLNQDVAKVEQLLSKGVPLSTTDNNGKTVFHYTVENDTPAILEKLLVADTSLLEAKDNDGYTPLQLATIGGNRPLIESLLNNNADVMTTDNEGHTPAHWATVCGHAGLLDYLADRGADLNSTDRHQARPMHYAAQMCGAANAEDRKTGTSMLKKLIAKGLPVDVEDLDKRSPLLWAASAGSPEGIELLVDAGAPVDSADKDGLTALHCSASKGYDKCIDVLNRKGANVDSMDKNGCTPLFYSVTLGKKDCTKKLLDKGANPDHRDSRGRTPAHCAAAKGSLDQIKILQDKNGNVWQKSNRGEYPIHEASLARQTDTVDYLLVKNQDKVNLKNNEGRTCLHIAALTNNLVLAKKLVARGAVLNEKMRGRDTELTPYDAAKLKSYNETAEYLREKGAKPASELIDQPEPEPEPVIEEPEKEAEEEQKAEEPVEEEKTEEQPIEEEKPSQEEPKVEETLDEQPVEEQKPAEEPVAVQEEAPEEHKDEPKEEPQEEPKPEEPPEEDPNQDKPQQEEPKEEEPAQEELKQEESPPEEPSNDEQPPEEPKVEEDSTPTEQKPAEEPKPEPEPENTPEETPQEEPVQEKPADVPPEAAAAVVAAGAATAGTAAVAATKKDKKKKMEKQKETQPMDDDRVKLSKPEETEQPEAKPVEQEPAKVEEPAEEEVPQKEAEPQAAPATEPEQPAKDEPSAEDAAPIAAAAVAGGAAAAGAAVALTQKKKDKPEEEDLDKLTKEERERRQREKDNWDYNAPDGDKKVDSWNKDYKGPNKSDMNPLPSGYKKPEGVSRLGTGGGKIKRSDKEKPEKQDPSDPKKWKKEDEPPVTPKDKTKKGKEQPNKGDKTGKDKKVQEKSDKPKEAKIKSPEPTTTKGEKAGLVAGAATTAAVVGGVAATKKKKDKEKDKDPAIKTKDGKDEKDADGTKKPKAKATNEAPDARKSDNKGIKSTEGKTKGSNVKSPEPKDGEKVKTKSEKAKSPEPKDGKMKSPRPDELEPGTSSKKGDDALVAGAVGAGVGAAAAGAAVGVAAASKKKKDTDKDKQVDGENVEDNKKKGKGVKSKAGKEITDHDKDGLVGKKDDDEQEDAKKKKNKKNVADSQEIIIDEVAAAQEDSKEKKSKKKGKNIESLPEKVEESPLTTAIDGGDEKDEGNKDKKAKKKRKEEVTEKTDDIAADGTTKDKKKGSESEALDNIESTALAAGGAATAGGALAAGAVTATAEDTKKESKSKTKAKDGEQLDEKSDAAGAEGETKKKKKKGKAEDGKTGPSADEIGDEPSKEKKKKKREGEKSNQHEGVGQANEQDPNLLAGLATGAGAAALGAAATAAASKNKNDGDRIGADEKEKNSEVEKTDGDDSQEKKKKKGTDLGGELQDNSHKKSAPQDMDGNIDGTSPEKKKKKKKGDIDTSLPLDIDNEVITADGEKTKKKKKKSIDALASGDEQAQGEQSADTPKKKKKKKKGSKIDPQDVEEAKIQHDTNTKAEAEQHLTMNGEVPLSPDGVVPNNFNVQGNETGKGVSIDPATGLPVESQISKDSLAKSDGATDSQWEDSAKEAGSAGEDSAGFAAGVAAGAVGAAAVGAAAGAAVGTATIKDEAKDPKAKKDVKKEGETRREPTLAEMAAMQKNKPQQQEPPKKSKKEKKEKEKKPLPPMMSLPLPASLSDASSALEKGGAKTPKKETATPDNKNRPMTKEEAADAVARRRKAARDPKDPDEPRLIKPLSRKKTEELMRQADEDDIANITLPDSARDGRPGKASLQERLDKILLPSDKQQRRKRDKSYDESRQAFAYDDPNDPERSRAGRKDRDRIKLSDDYNRPDGHSKIDTWNRNMGRRGWEGGDEPDSHRGRSRRGRGGADLNSTYDSEGPPERWAERAIPRRHREPKKPEVDPRPTTMASGNPRQEIEAAAKKKKKKKEPRPKSVLDETVEREEEEKEWEDVKTAPRRRRELPKVERKTLKNEIQELVRIFEAKTTALSGINKSRKLTLYHSYRGGMAERKLVDHLKYDYNNAQRMKTRADFGNVQDWERYLAEVVAQAEADEKALRSGRQLMIDIDGIDDSSDYSSDEMDAFLKPGPYTQEVTNRIEMRLAAGYLRLLHQEDADRRGKWDEDSYDSSPRFNPLQSRESLNSFWSSKKGDKTKVLGPLKDVQRRQREADRQGKLTSAYGPVLPKELKLDTPNEKSSSSLNISKSSGLPKQKSEMSRRDVDSRGTDSTLPYLDSDISLQFSGRRSKSYSDNKANSSYRGPSLNVAKPRHTPKQAKPKPIDISDNPLATGTSSRRKWIEAVKAEAIKNVERQKTIMSRERTNISRQANSEKEKSSISREKTNVSREKTNVSREKTNVSREKTNISREKANASRLSKLSKSTSNFESTLNLDNDDESRQASNLSAAGTAKKKKKK